MWRAGGTISLPGSVRRLEGDKSVFGMPGCCCEEEEPPCVPTLCDPYPDQYEVGYDDVTPCAFLKCGDGNPGTLLLTWNTGTCRHRKDSTNPFGCTLSGNLTSTLFLENPTVELIFEFSGGLQVIYQLASSSWDCMGANTMDLTTNNTACTFPATMTVTAV